MHKKYNYYSLEKEKKTFWQHVLDILKAPFRLPGWIVSFFLARNITHVALNPNNVPQQRLIHLTKISNRPEDDIVVVNFKKRPPHKWFNDTLIKIANTIAALPFVTPRLRTRLHYDNDNDVNHVNSLLAEIDALVQGKSNQKYCEGRAFDWSKIHLKGLEFLDPKMRGYVYEQLHEKYGLVSYTTKRKPNIEFFTLKTPDGSELDSVQVTGEEEEQKSMGERKFIITCIARDQNFINWIKDLNYTAKNLGATAISFNYRGVDYSRGLVWTENNLVDDILAQVQRLISLGADPRNICLDGMCIGGAVATIAAAKLHEKGMKVKLNNERSFTSLSSLVFGFIVPELQTANWWSPLTYGRFVLAGVVYVLLTPLIWMAGWPVDVTKAWNRIPAQDKMYSVVRDKDNGLYDGVIHDHFCSIAALVDSQINSILYKLSTDQPLTEEEKQILCDDQFSHHFKPSQSVLKNPKYKGPHFISRQDLVAELGHREEYTNHDYFLDRLREKFQLDRAARPVALAEEEGKDIEGITPQPSKDTERPLIIASSGGTGHISATHGIINDLQSKKDNVVITQHHAELYKNKPFSITSALIRIGVWFTSLPILEDILKGVMRFIGYPVLPSSSIFWDQMSKIQQSETKNENGIETGRTRPYVDMLLDIYPEGYEYTAFNNATHLTSSIEDIQTMISFKGHVEEDNRNIVYQNILQRLMRAAKQNTPYTRLISTQALSLGAICDAVKYYNTVFLPVYNAERGTSYQPITIDQYMTDLPSLGCIHFMNNLEELTSEQRQLMEVHAVNMSEPFKEAHFGKEQGFKAVHNIDPRNNPMIRNAFKDPSLTKYLDKTQAFDLHFNVYKKEKQNALPVLNGKETITIKPHAKIASIMIGSLAANASADYAKYLLNQGYDHIFLFGGLNDSIATSIDQIINSYPASRRDEIRKKIILLGNQSDVEMAPIMTRSNCVVIRGGGLSVMEQMAMPIMDEKIILLHHEDNEDGPLTSGLSWEDGNADKLIEYLSEKGAYAKKTSPGLCSGHLHEAEKSFEKKYHAQLKSTETKKKVDLTIPQQETYSLKKEWGRKTGYTESAHILSHQHRFFNTIPEVIEPFCSKEDVHHHELSSQSLVSVSAG
ncbi:TPA: Dot/Icm T4SS effector SdbA [Legionella pneumophila]|nr:Dot/Icm T4SS effector SdbA [Legionella pneumophila]